ncbi:uncharacterized protein [Linepithema humile]|uniref:uncharacterized protein n=1 Tax=Linepithema humile TaxID=83485 RepID=UPI00351ED124
MASFRPKFQISSLLTSNNKYNLFLWQQPWHCFQPTLYSQRNINKERRHNCKKLISASTSDPKSRVLKGQKKMRFLSLRRTSSMKIKDMPSVICKAQKSPKQKLTLWEYMFGSDRKKSRVDSCICRLAHRQRQAHRDEIKDPRLCDPRYQKTAGDVLIYTEPARSLKESKRMEPQPKPPPAYKMPKAVLLNKMMTGDFKVSKNF